MHLRLIILLGAVFVLVFLLSSCSTEREIEPEIPAAEVSEIPTPVQLTPEASKVFSHPKQPEEFIDPSYRQVYEPLELKNIDAKRACEILSRIVPEAVFMEGARSTQVIAKGAQEDISRIKKLITSFDVPARQVMIESKVVEMSLSAMESLGVTWTGAGNGIKLAVNGRGVAGEDISAVVTALIGSGNARLIACPSISTLDDQEASVNIGSKIPFAVPVNSSSPSVQWAVQYIDAGVSLKITPRTGQDGRITISINPEVSSVSEWRMTAAGEFPVISTRNARTRIQVRDGQTIAIGGLINETDRDNITKIPFAGEIPLIKELFTKKTSERTRTEVVFLITPRII